MAKIQSTDLKNRVAVTGMLRDKQDRRKELARMPIEKKLEMVTKLRDAGYKLRSARKQTPVKE